MAREPAAYRDNYEDLLAFFGGKRLLSISDVAQYTRKSRAWCKKHFGIDPILGISVPTLARKLAGAS